MADIIQNIVKTPTKRILRLILLSQFLSLNACTPTIKEIHVFYLTGDVDTSVSVSTSDLLKEYIHTPCTDTIVVGNTLFFDTLSNIKIKDKRMPNFDGRVIIITNNRFIFIGRQPFEVCDFSYRQFDISEKMVYQILVHSKYFNYWEKETLFFREDIKKYGIPHNYCEIDRFNTLKTPIRFCHVLLKDS